MRDAAKAAFLPQEPKDRNKLWFWLFMVGSVVGLVGVTLHEVLLNTDDSLALTTLLVFRDTGSVIVGVAAGAYVVSEASIVIPEKFLNSQFAKG